MTRDEIENLVYYRAYMTDIRDDVSIQIEFAINRKKMQRLRRELFTFVPTLQISE
jgi:hypothetical protein